MYSYVEAMSSKGSLRTKDFVQLFLTLLAIFLSANVLFNYVSQSRRKIFKHMSAIPGPWRVPLLGNTLQLYGILKNPTKALAYTGGLNQYGPVSRFWLFDDPKVVVTCAETALYLLNKDLVPSKSSGVTHAANVMGGNGLIALPPHLHTKRRKMWSPSFSRKRIENAIFIFRREAIKLCKELEGYCSAKEDEPIVFDLFKHSMKCAFAVICSSAFGSEYMVNVTEARANEHNYSLHTVAKNLTWRFFRPWLINDFFYLNFTSLGRETKRCVEIGNALAKEALQARKQLRAATPALANSNRVDSENCKPEISECFLDHLLDLMDEGALNETEVLQELNTFIAAGYDTSGVTISYVLYFLSLYPHYQNKVVEELYNIIGRENLDKPRLSEYEFTPGDVRNMRFMEQCLKETLRIYPILPILLRRTTSDVEIPDTKTVIPEGVDVFISIHKIHHDPKLFPEPDKFKPERHVTPKVGWMPFSLGSRNCIGQIFGMYEIKVLLAHLLLSYEFETLEEEGFKPIYSVIYVPENGMRFRITKRVHPKC